MGIEDRIKTLSENRILLLLGVFYILTRLLLISYTPFIQDEALYSVMILEQGQTPTLVPTYLGYEVGWKPPLFFWVYSVITGIIFKLPLSPEFIFKFPTFLFGLINVFLLYWILRSINTGKVFSFLATLAHSSIFLVLYVNNTVLIDTLLMAFVLSGILLYVKPGLPQWRFILAGLFAFAAFFTKFWLALMIPLLAIAYFFFHRRETLANPVFCLSLLAIPIAWLVFSSFFVHENTIQQDSGISYIIKNRIMLHEKLPLIGMNNSFSLFFLLTSVWLPFSLFGFIRHFRECPMMSLWFLLIIFPIASGFFMPWYYLPVMVPMAFFSTKLLLGKENLFDLFALVVLTLLIIGSFAFGLTMYEKMHERYIDQKNAAKIISFKENSLIIGEYCPSVPAYKILNEGMAGNESDFGWVLLPNDWDDAAIWDFMENYNTAGHRVYQGSFDRIFENPRELPGIFRKDSNISHAEYLVICGFSGYFPDGELLHNSSSVRVYKMGR